MIELSDLVRCCDRVTVVLFCVVIIEMLVEILSGDSFSAWTIGAAHNITG